MKERKKNGQLGPLEKSLVETAEKTLTGIDAGTIDAAEVVNDTTGTAKVDGVEVTTKIDTKTIFIGIAAVLVLLYFSKK